MSITGWQKSKENQERFFCFFEADSWLVLDDGWYTFLTFRPSVGWQRTSLNFKLDLACKMVRPVLQTPTSVLIVVNNFWTHKFSPLSYQFLRILFWRILDGQGPFAVSAEDHSSPFEIWWRSYFLTCHCRQETNQNFFAFLRLTCDSPRYHFFKTNLQNVQWASYQSAWVPQIWIEQ